MTVVSLRLSRSFCSRFYSFFGGFAGFVSVVSFRWFRFGVSGFTTCHFVSKWLRKHIFKDFYHWFWAKVAAEAIAAIFLLGFFLNGPPWRNEIYLNLQKRKHKQGNLVMWQRRKIIVARILAGILARILARIPARILVQSLGILVYFIIDFVRKWLREQWLFRGLLHQRVGCMAS